MATNRTRKARGAETQNMIAHWFKGHGWPFAESAGAGRVGRDVLGMPGLAPEVKARADFTPLAWLRQAKAAASTDLPFVVWRPNGMGFASIQNWGVMLTLEDFTALLRDAGYGDPQVPQVPPGAWDE
jgi:hypothetical protein